MANENLGWIANFIWGIADDVLRDLYVRGKYRDVILPMTVLRRLDAVLGADQEGRARHEGDARQGGDHQPGRGAPRRPPGRLSTTRRNSRCAILSTGRSQQQLKADFEAYLDGFSPNVQEILDNFEFRNQIPRLSKADALGTLIEKFLDPVDQPQPEPGAERRRLGQASGPRQPRDGHDLRGTGPALQRGEQRGGRRALDAARRREADGEADLPADRRPDRVGHLSALRRRLRHRRHADGRRGNAATARRRSTASRSRPTSTARRSTPRPTPSPRPTCCSKAKARRPTTSSAARNTRRCRTTPFRSREFDFMLSNPPYGKSWKSDLERMGGKDGIKDPRFRHRARGRSGILARHPVERRPDAVPGQHALEDEARARKLGSRIAEVHNGSSLFTGDAGQGESNIRRWIIENDWLEAIVALPLNMFYNTGIATYIWVLTNRKAGAPPGQGAADRRDRLVQAAAQESRQEELRAVRRRHRAHLRDAVSPSRRPSNRRSSRTRRFGYWKVTVERPLRHQGIDPERAYTPKEIKALKAKRRRRSGRRRRHSKNPQERCYARSAARAVSTRRSSGKHCVVEYEPDSDLRDTEQVPLAGGGRDRGLHPARGAAPRAGRLDRPERDQDRLRDQLHPIFLQAAALALARRNPRRTSWPLEKETEGLLKRSSGAGMIDGLKPYPANKDFGVPVAGTGARALGGAAALAAIILRGEEITRWKRACSSCSRYEPVCCRQSSLR